MIVRSPIKIRTAMPAIWHISTGIKLPKSSENFSEIPRTAAPIRLIMAAEKAGNTYSAVAVCRRSKVCIYTNYKGKENFSLQVYTPPIYSMIYTEKV